MIRRILAIMLPVALVLFVAAVPAQAQAPAGDSTGANGRIVGTVIDEANAMTLPRVPVEVVGTDTVVFTDLDGRFSVSLPPGTYELQIAYSGYQERTIRGVQVSPDTATRVDIVLYLEGMGVAEEVTVTAGEPATATQEAQLLERRRAGAVMDNIGSEQMAANNDSDAASAVERVTGLSVVDSSYVFVRGLGARYSNSTLNGTTLPTTEPDKRVVPLDLFPTGMVDSVQVIKSYLPDRPGEFSGGLVQIESLAFPDEQTLGFSVGQGGDSQTAFQDGLTYDGGDRDWLGFDDGTRDLPFTAAQKAVKGGIFTDLGFTQDELEDFGERFNNVWSPVAENNSQNQSYSLSYGNAWDSVGLVASYSYKNDHHYQTEEQNYFRVGANQQISVRNAYDFEVNTDTVKQGAVANLSLRPGLNNKIVLENFWTHSANDETRIFEGFNDDIATNIRNYRLRWVEEDILSNKVSGTHFVPSAANSRVEWFVARSQADREEPDLREILYEENNDVFVLADESRSGLRQFIDQTDEIWEGGVDYSFFFEGSDGLPIMVKFGPHVSFRERDFTSRQFRFRHRFTSNVDLALAPEQLFTAENIGVAFELNEETRPTDSYTGEHDILAGYAMVDVPVNERVRIVGGVRVENSEQTVNSFDPFSFRLGGDEGGDISTTLDDTDLLPGVNLIFSVRPDMNLRFSGSQTVNRPQFRELAPFEFTDVVGGRAVVGNPDLQRALVRSFDVRWEMFPGPAEVLAASFFFKDFEDPIERVVEPTAQLRTSYTNAESARNIGFELEAQKSLGGNFEAGANYTYVDSSIELAQAAGQVQTSLERPLAGTSENLFNGFLEVRSPDHGISVRGLVNFFGDRIVDVGAQGLPDIIEEGREQVDLVVTWSYDAVTIRGSIENLTDADYEFTQGGQAHRLFRVGRDFGVSVSLDVF